MLLAYFSCISTSTRGCCASTKNSSLQWWIAVFSCDSVHVSIHSTAHLPSAWFQAPGFFEGGSSRAYGFTRQTGGLVCLIHRRFFSCDKVMNAR